MKCESDVFRYNLNPIDNKKYKTYLSALCDVMLDKKTGILSIVENGELKPAGTKNFAEFLGCTQRNAQFIFKRLDEQGLATKSYSEYYGRKCFFVNFPALHNLSYAPTNVYKVFAYSYHRNLWRSTFVRGIEEGDFFSETKYYPFFNQEEINKLSLSNEEFEVLSGIMKLLRGENNRLCVDNLQTRTPRYAKVSDIAKLVCIDESFCRTMIDKFEDMGIIFGKHITTSNDEYFCYDVNPTYFYTEDFRRAKMFRPKTKFSCEM